MATLVIFLYLLIGIGFVALALFEGRVVSLLVFVATSVFVLMIAERVYALLAATVVGLAALPYGPRSRPRSRGD
jgi:hypothetical protein